jgi:TolA-binding protein/HEAT repeat protein
MYVLSLLLAVATVVQDSAATAPRPRRARRVHAAVAIAPLAMSAAVLETAAAQLAAARVDLVAAQAPVLATSAVQLQQAAIALPALAVLTDVADVDDVDDVDESVPPQPWAQQDPADSLYRSARRALNRNQYARAAELFQSIQKRYPRSTYTADSFYWQAFALYRAGQDDGLRAARAALFTQATRFPKASTHHDAEVLLRRVQGELAKRGDRDADEWLRRDADRIAPEAPDAVDVPEPAEPAEPPEPAEPAEPSDDRRSSSCDDEDDVRIAAIQGLMNMDAERAVPILKAVLARRDAGSVCLRRKAVWLVSQKRSPETSAILLNAVRSDPDREVREQAVFWLSQVPGDETVSALDSILRDPKTDPEIQDKAIFALSQHRSPRAGAILRAFAERRDAPSELREKAIFWLGQNRSAENAQFLKDLFKKLENDDLREKVIFSLSQMGGTDNYRWLMDIALDPNQNIEIRKKALFWAGQGKSVDIGDLVRLYDSMKDREMREQLIFVYSQRREDAALDKLFDIGKNDPDRELRKKAIFWIGQSRSPRAAQYLQDLINQ